MIIGISGKIGSGKDTVGRIIQYLIATTKEEEFKDNTFEDFLNSIYDFDEEQKHDVELSGFEIKKFAYKLKQIVSILTGCTVEDLESQEFKNTELGNQWNSGHNIGSMTTYRELLQKLGTNIMRDKVHDNIWVNALFADYKGEFNQYHKDEFSNRAFPNWIITDMRFPNEMKAVEDRSGITIRVQRGIETNTGHESETALDLYKFNYVIDNNDIIDELIEKVKEVLIKEKLL